MRMLKRLHHCAATDAAALLTCHPILGACRRIAFRRLIRSHCDSWAAGSCSYTEISSSAQTAAPGIASSMAAAATFCGLSASGAARAPAAAARCAARPAVAQPCSGWTPAARDSCRQLRRSARQAAAARRPLVCRAEQVGRRLAAVAWCRRCRCGLGCEAHATTSSCASGQWRHHP